MLERIETYALILSLGLNVIFVWLLAMAGLFRWEKDLKDRVSWLGFAVVLLLLLATLVSRGVLLNRFPLANLYESLLFFAAGFSLIFVFFLRHFAYLSLTGMITLAAILSAAFLLPETQKAALPLIPALRSYWRIIHVPPLMVSYAFFLMAAFTGLAYLFTEWLFKREQSEQQEKLAFYQEGIYRCISFGFPLLTFGIITGAVWANQSWGNLWQWDPKENLALATWFCYAAYLHLRMTGKASERVLAWISIIGILATYMTYIGINQFDLGGLHTYGKV
ncbi:MAG: c-type cytochrome biogenesis protein CcsB [Candidatus Caenarcaniphilales bacterium]|nr:c-type cytochrome biogenesis protein CcsB [Candidatus Caenarcaniphilales bacterium]